jgi:hypothetical protein
MFVKYYSFVILRHQAAFVCCQSKKWTCSILKSSSLLMKVPTQKMGAVFAMSLSKQKQHGKEQIVEVVAKSLPTFLVKVVMISSK